MKCDCGVELFECDIVEKNFSEYTHGYAPFKYRCPKCFKVTKIKLK